MQDEQGRRESSAEKSLLAHEAPVDGPLEKELARELEGPPEVSAGVLEERHRELCLQARHQPAQRNCSEYALGEEDEDADHREHQ